MNLYPLGVYFLRLIERATFSREPSVLMGTVNRHQFVRYGAGVLAVLLASLLGQLELFAPMRFLVFLFTVLAVAWCAGIGPGMVAAGLSCVALDLVILAPSHAFWTMDPPDLLRIFVFAVAVLFVNASVSEAWVAVSEHRFLQRQLAQAREELEKKLQSFQGLVDSLDGHAIFTVDINSRISSWNAAAQALTGYGARQIVGQDLSCLCDKASATVRVPSVHDETGALGIPNEFMFVRRDGSTFRARLAVRALSKKPIEGSALAGSLVVIQVLDGNEGKTSARITAEASLTQPA